MEWTREERRWIVLSSLLECDYSSESTASYVARSLLDIGFTDCGNNEEVFFYDVLPPFIFHVSFGVDVWFKEQEVVETVWLFKKKFVWGFLYRIITSIFPKKPWRKELEIIKRTMLLYAARSAYLPRGFGKSTWEWDDRQRDKIISELKPFAVRLNRGLAFYNKKIDERPKERFWLESRAQLFMNHGLLKSAKKDVDRLLALGGENWLARYDYRCALYGDYGYYSCMLEESINGRSAEVIACYWDIYENEKVVNEGFITELLVFSALMGELPDADELRKKYLEEIEDEEYRTLLTNAITPFDRNKFLLKNVEL